MAHLSDMLKDEEKKRKVIDDCLLILDQEVADKKGLTGMAVKTGYKVVKEFKPGFVQNVVRDLLPEFVAAIDPIYQEAVEQEVSPKEYLKKNDARMADALLTITDEKVERSENRIIRKTYGKLRGKAKDHVAESAPRLGELIEKHAPPEN